MKTTKRILACLMILAMLAAMLCVGASAITISGKTEDAEYTYYKVFGVESDTDSADTVKAIRYTVDNSSGLHTWLKGDGAAYVTDITVKPGAPTISYVELNITGSNVATFADAVIPYLGAATGTAIADVFNDPNYEATAPLGNGYYVMKSSVSEIPFAFTVVGDKILTEIAATNVTSTTITEKMGLPNIEKFVGTAVDPSSDTATANFGDTVYFKIVIAAEEGAHNYKVVDTLSGGFTAPNASAVKVSFKGSDITSAVAGKITISGQVITVDLTEYCADNSGAINASDQFVITYPAVLNATANVGDTGNTNSAKLAYGSVSIENTEKKDSATVYTDQFKVQKTDNASNPLGGAKFKLYDALTGGNEIKVVKVGTGEYRKAIGAEEGVEIEAGLSTIKGLANGTYYLEETVAPVGYKKLDVRTAVTVDYNDGSVVTAIVPNTPGSILPETGGIGTTVFYAVGGLLVLGAVVVLLMKKRSVTE